MTEAELAIAAYESVAAPKREAKRQALLREQLPILKAKMKEAEVRSARSGSGHGVKDG